MRAQRSIKKYLTLNKDYLPHQCLPNWIKRFDDPKTSFTRHLRARLIEVCYKQLGKRILAKHVPTQRSCRVGQVYRGIQAFKVHTPALDRLMAEAAKKCE